MLHLDGREIQIAPAKKPWFQMIPLQITIDNGFPWFPSGAKWLSSTHGRFWVPHEQKARRLAWSQFDTAGSGQPFFKLPNSDIWASIQVEISRSWCVKLCIWRLKNHVPTWIGYRLSPQFPCSTNPPNRRPPKFDAPTNISFG